MNTETPTVHSGAKPLTLRIGKTYRTRGGYELRATGVNYDTASVTVAITGVPSPADRALWEVGEETDLRLDGRYFHDRPGPLDIVECLNPGIVTTCKMLIEVPLANVDAVINSGVAVLEMR